MKLNSPTEFGTNRWMSEACSCEGDAEGYPGSKFPGPLLMVIPSNCAQLLYMNHGLRPAPLAELNLYRAKRVLILAPEAVRDGR